MSKHFRIATITIPIFPTIPVTGNSSFRSVSFGSTSIEYQMMPLFWGKMEGGKVKIKANDARTASAKHITIH